MTLAEYFSQNRYQSQYDLGTRVGGKFHNIPFVGSVGTDSVRFDGEPPHVTVTLDLPLRYKDTIHNVIRVPTNSVKIRK